MPQQQAEDPMSNPISFCHVCGAAEPHNCEGRAAEGRHEPFATNVFDKPAYVRAYLSAAFLGDVTPCDDPQGWPEFKITTTPYPLPTGTAKPLTDHGKTICRAIPVRWS